MDDIIASSQPKFQKVLDVVKQDLNTIRTGKASPQLLENLIVEAYETKMKMLEVATITASDTTTLVITPFDQANSAAIAKAVQDSNLGLTAFVEETHVRVVVPALSEERRQEYVKLAKSKIEGGKVMTRQVRHDAMQEISKMETDEDSMKALETELQRLTDGTVEKLELLLVEKEKELMTV